MSIPITLYHHNEIIVFWICKKKSPISFCQSILLQPKKIYMLIQRDEVNFVPWTILHSHNAGHTEDTAFDSHKVLWIIILKYFWWMTFNFIISDIPHNWSTTDMITICINHHPRTSSFTSGGGRSSRGTGTGGKRKASGQQGTRAVQPYRHKREPCAVPPNV